MRPLSSPAYEGRPGGSVQGVAMIWIRRGIGAALLLLAVGMLIPFPAQPVTIKVDLPPAVSPHQAHQGLAWFEAAIPAISVAVGAALVLALVVGGLWLIVPTVRRGPANARRP